MPVVFWALAAVAVLVDTRPLKALGAGRRLTTVFLSVPFTFAILLLWGTGPAVAVQTVALLAASWRLRLAPAWIVFVIGRFALAIGAAGAVLDAFGPAPSGFGSQGPRLGFGAIVAAAATWFAVSYAILLVGLRLRYRAGWWSLIRRSFAFELLSASALMLIVPAFVTSPTWWAIALLLVPIIAARMIMGRPGERAGRDPLTGLLTRRGLFTEFDERVGSGVEEPAGPFERFAVLLLDLNQFDKVNGALGHTVGERLLTEVGRRLTTAVRPEDLVARLGADEFAILAPGVPDAATARTLATQVSQALAEPAYVDGLPLDVSASVGVALSPDHGRDILTLMNHADAAMYEAKEQRGAVAVYSEHVEQASPEHLSLLADLRLALEEPARRDEISFHYQPQVAIATGEVVGMEALLRWHHPVRGEINPADAVLVAEYSSAMHLLTLRAFDSILGQLSAWNARGLFLQASINVSVRDLQTTVLADYLTVALGRSDLRPGQLEVEITETALMSDPQTVLAASDQLANLGVKLALDDFGMGYSSLQHLRRLPLSEVKIDRSFVQSMATNRDDEAIVRAVIQLAHALGLRVVAEGVEDDVTQRLLAAAGCDVGQGWYYAPAMPTDELAAWLADRPHRPAE